MHSVLMVRMLRSITAKPPHLPSAPTTRLDGPATTLPPESRRDDLRALVGDEVFRPHSRPPTNTLKKSPNCGRRWLCAADREAHDASRVVVDNNSEPPAEGLNPGQKEGKPRGPEAQGSGNRRQFDVPEAIWFPCGDDENGWMKSFSKLGSPRRLHDPMHGRRPEMEARGSIHGAGGSSMPRLPSLPWPTALRPR